MSTPSKPSHKRKKLRFEDRRKALVKRSRSSTDSSKTTSTNNNNSSSLSNQSASLLSPPKNPNSSLGNKTTPILKSLKDDTYFTSLRTMPAPRDMLSQITKDVINNFEVNYTKNRTSRTSSRRSARLRFQRIDDRNDANSIDNNDDDLDSNNSLNNLSEYRRCLLEDFMALSIGSDLMIFIPYDVRSDNLRRQLFWITSPPDRFATNYYGTITIKNSKYYIVEGTVITNPKLNEIKSGMQMVDVRDSLNEKNAGCVIDCGKDPNDNQLSSLLTWRLILDGKTDGIQVWSKRYNFRSLYSSFMNRRKTVDGLNSILNLTFNELYGDRVQCSHLLTLYYKAALSQTKLKVNEKDKIIATLSNETDVSFDGESFQNLIDKVDTTFKDALNETFCDFSVLGDPIVPSNTIDELIELYKKLSVSKPAPIQDAVATSTLA